MVSSVPSPPPLAADRDHGFHAVRVARVVQETDEAASFVLDPPPELRERFAYRAGQFCTFRVVIDGTPHLRCYSMASAPEVDDELKVTVKRVPGGRVSGWMLDSLTEGAAVEATFPAGVFCLPDAGPDGGPVGDLVAAAAGSGITPVISLVKAALAGSDRRVRLLYANRDRASTIFAGELDALATAHPDRLTVVHHHDVDAGFVDGAGVRRALGAIGPTDDCYVCGPTPFMDLVEEALLAAGAAPDRLHIERFTPATDTSDDAEAAEDAGGTAGGAAEAGATTVTIDLDGQVETTEHRPGTTILQVARQLGLSPPFSCESGSCATCMARLVDGTVTMHVNDALDDDEVAEGWILTCQSVPTSPVVSVVYGYD